MIQNLGQKKPKAYFVAVHKYSVFQYVCTTAAQPDYYKILTCNRNRTSCHTILLRALFGRLGLGFKASFKEVMESCEVYPSA